MRTVRVARRLTQSERRILASEYSGCRGRDRKRWFAWLASFAAVVRDAAEQHGKADGIRMLLEHVSLEHAVALCSGGPALLPADIHQARSSSALALGDLTRMIAEDRAESRRTMADLVREAQERALADLPRYEMHMLGISDLEPVTAYSTADYAPLGERFAEAVRSAGIPPPDHVWTIGEGPGPMSDDRVSAAMRGLGWDVAWDDEARD